MAALVQSYPQQTSTVTMLQGRPSSSGGSFGQQHSTSRSQQLPRFNSSSNAGSYRGLPSSGLVAPYAYTSTPPLTNNAAFLHNAASPHLRPQNRTLSAPNLLAGSQQSMSSASILSARHRFATSSSLSTSSSSSNSLPQNKKSMDDASITTRETSVDVPARPKSTLGLSPSNSMQFGGSLAPPKPSPDRYRSSNRSSQSDFSNNSGTNRIQAVSASPSGSGMLAVGHLYTNTSHPPNNPSNHTFQNMRGERSGQPKNASTDDLTLTRPQSNMELAQRYRRRSVGSFEAVGDLSKSSSQTFSPQTHAIRGEARDRRQSPDAQRPASSHTHQGSSDSVSSSRSARSTGQHSTRMEHGPVAGVAVAGPMHATSISKQEVKLVNVPPRNDSSKRLNTPSPLSKPSTMNDASAGHPTSPQKTYNPGSAKPVQPRQDSPAAQQLAAINKDVKKKSKLRRAFSFGSANELRRASAHNNIDRGVVTEQSTKRNSKFEDEMDPEQAEIAQKQEAGGLGESIYSGQGNFFTSSTDNLSIQSSASSASIMLRKMGKGVKKSTRSIVGLFRPKSVIGVAAADGPVTSAAQVSMVTVEAEREKVNVNLNPHDQIGGGTGFPKLERNSIDAGTSVENNYNNNRTSNDARPRRSIIGGESERAEVLAAVKKGILKRNDSTPSSPATTPRAYRVPDFNLPQIPQVNDSPNSSEPSTPSDGAPPRSGHRRTDSVTIEGSDSDYFSSITQFAAFGSPGAPLTPQGSLARNISFSPRIQFHDTWPSMEYDRRGDIATCNRLTPMLAQQIKEELNTFKMEMEVHESSKVYTHFF